MESSWECASAEDLRALGRDWAQRMAPGTVVALIGNLGVGKTEFTKGLAAGLDYQEEVTSPTFALLQEYHGGRMSLYHLDFYRLESEAEVLDLGWDELLERGGVVVVEWSDRFPGLIPPEAWTFEITHCSMGGRWVKQVSPPPDLSQ